MDKKQISLATLKKDVEEAIAYMDDCCKEGATVADLQSIISYTDQRMRYIQESIDRLWSQLYEHTSDGHLPKLVGAGQMQKAIDALGLSEDYKVEKRVIYASDGKPTEAWFKLEKKD